MIHYIDVVPDKHGFAMGMRDESANLCWFICDGSLVCIRSHGHDGGVHELPDSEVWITRGRRIPLDEMEEGHLRRAITYMQDKLAIPKSSGWETKATPKQRIEIQRKITTWTELVDKLTGEQLRRIGAS